MFKQFSITDILLFISALSSLIFSEVLYFMGETNDALFIGRTEIKLSENSIIKADEAILKETIEELFKSTNYNLKDVRKNKLVKPINLNLLQKEIP